MGLFQNTHFGVRQNLIALINNFRKENYCIFKMLISLETRGGRKYVKLVWCKNSVLLGNSSHF